ncbi:hypothetical protein N0V90_013368 [Kalmusia sp. IMI 367209]|nr:hypothetical protein N0V90_013368 [Kalmusia sp. IMI 367209]
MQETVLVLTQVNKADEVVQASEEGEGGRWARRAGEQGKQASKEEGQVSIVMLLKNILFLGLAVLTAANPILDARAGKTDAGAGTAVGGKTGGIKAKGAAQCKDQTPVQGPVTCPRDKFTAAQITKTVKQANAMKLKGKTGKGLHFPARYKPKQETKAKGAAKGVKGKTSKAVKRYEDEEEDEEDSLSFLESRDENEQEEWVNLALEAREVEEEHLNILEDAVSRPAKKRPAKPTKKPVKKPTKKPFKKPTCTPAQKKANGGKCPAKKGAVKCSAAQKKANGGKCPAKATCTAAEKKKNGGKCPAKCPNSKPVKPGKGVYMLPLLTKGVWKPGMMTEVNYIILDAKYNYVKTVEREPGSAEFYETCIEKLGAKGGKATGGKATKGKTV